MAGPVTTGALVLTTGFTVGKVLDVLQTKVQNILKDFQNTGLILERELGCQISNAIINLQAAYNKELGITADKVDTILQDKLFRLESMVDRLEKKVKDFSQKEFAALVYALPFSAFSVNKPQVTNFSPKYIANPDEMQNLVFKVEGYFPRHSFTISTLWANKLPLSVTPEITLSKLSFTITQKSAGKIFLSHLDKSRKESSAEHVSLMPYEVVFDCENKGWLRTSSELVKFNSLLTILPSSPGSFQLITFDKKSFNVTSKLSETQVFRLSANERCTSKSFSIKPQSGWEIDLRSVNFDVLEKKGYCRYGFTKMEKTEVIWLVEAFAPHGHKRDPGEISFQIKYQEYLAKNEKKEDWYSIPWGGSQAIEGITLDTAWRVNYIGFKGIQETFIKPEGNHPYISINHINCQLLIKVKKPEEIEEFIQI